MMKLLFVLATVLATAGAYCPNNCSKNGSCGANGKPVHLGFVQLFPPPSVLISSSLRLSQTNALVTIAPMETQHGQATIAP